MRPNIDNLPTEDLRGALHLVPLRTPTARTFHQQRVTLYVRALGQIHHFDHIYDQLIELLGHSARSSGRRPLVVTVSLDSEWSSVGATFRCLDVVAALGK